MRLRWTWVTLGLVVAGCGDVVSLGSGASGDGGSRDAAGGGSGRDGSGGRDGGRTGHEGGAARTEAGHGDAGTDARHSDGPTYIDAGYYRGDGSFFVDGGAYPRVDARTEAGGGGEADAAFDATSGCGALAACCYTLTSASQSLCNTVAASGSTTNCATELTQFQSLGDCTGVSVLASQMQVPANRIVSDGTTLFWTTAETPGLLAMPVHGGTVTVLISGPLANTFDTNQVAAAGFLSVDDTNLYLLQNNSLIRIPKNGRASSLVTEFGASVIDATILGATAFWVEETTAGAVFSEDVTVKSTPLLGGPISSLGRVHLNNPFFPVLIGVTSSTVFLGGPGDGMPSNLYRFPIAAGVPSGGPALTVQPSTSLTSDTSAVYCSAGDTASNVAVASDGTAATVGTADGSSYIVFDDTYAYWADETTVGTIMKAPKAGGGTAVVLARDTNPTAIGVDATSVYWGDQGGYIKSVPK
jgi:hypothetical protein